MTYTSEWQSGAWKLGHLTHTRLWNLPNTCETFQTLVKPSRLWNACETFETLVKPSKTTQTTFLKWHYGLYTKVATKYNCSLVRNCQISLDVTPAAWWYTPLCLRQTPIAWWYMKYHYACMPAKSFLSIQHVRRASVSLKFRVAGFKGCELGSALSDLTLLNVQLLTI